MAVNLEISARLTRFNPSVKQFLATVIKEAHVPDDVVLKLGELSITETAQFSGLAAKQEDLEDFFKVLDKG